jgi:hypothetical protein
MTAKADDFVTTAPHPAPALDRDQDGTGVKGALSAIVHLPKEANADGKPG